MRASRRGLLGFLVVGAGVMAGCGGGGRTAANSRLSPDGVIGARAVGGARALASLYGAAIAHGGADRAQAVMYRDHHLAHIQRLTTGTSGPSAATGALPAASSNPNRTALAAAERSAAGTSAADLTAVSGNLAAVLASIAACRALHAQSLDHSQSPDVPALTMAKSDRASTDALQTVLSAENAVIFAFGALGPHLTGGQRTAAHEAFNLHRGQRDVLMDAITAHGASPQAAEASYNLPFAVSNPASACRLAALVETRLAAVCAQAVAEASGGSRRYAAWALTQAALRAQTWGTPMTAFPGLSA